MSNLLCFILLLVVSVQAHAIKPEELLQADDAFKFKAEVVAPDKIKATWEIAEGYYLYRERFKFETTTPDVTLDVPVFPKGDIKNDPNMGQTEVFHHDIVVEIPFKRGQNAAQAVELALNVKYQGCADAGICFQPQKKIAALQLSATEPAATPKSDSAALPDIIKQAQKPSAGSTLPVDKAFVFDMAAVDKGTLNARWIIQPDHHLYRPKIKFTVKEPLGITLGTPLFPAGETVQDEYFGEIEVYGKDFDVQVPILQATGLQKLVVETEYQGCADKTGVCYPPVTQTRELTLTGLPDAKPRANSDTDAIAQAPLNKQDALTQRLEDSSLVQIIAITFGLGLLLAFTPCIFPMIPILSGIIAGYGNTSSRKALWLSVTYVVSGAVAYAIIGFVFGYFGQNLQAVLQHPIAIGLMSALFVALAFSMFGFYDLQLPNSLQSRLNEISNKQESGSFVGAAIMGFLSTLIVGPCAGPAIAGILTFITQSHNAWLGAAALFSLGMGIGVPLILIGTSAGHLLPRAGVWMDTVKALFGIIMLGVAIYMLSRIVSIEITMALTGILLVSSGVYMGALEKIDEDAGGWGRFWKSTGMLQLFYGALILLGLSAGSTNLLQPLKGIFSVGIANAQPAETMSFKRVIGLDGLEAALQQAKAQKRPVMLDFYADWCSYCQTMEKVTFKDPAAAKALGNTLFLQADVTSQSEHDLALQKRFDVVAPPAIVFFNDAGEELRALRLVGDITPEQLRTHAATFMQQAVK
ncbi:protein-disulfide reductase DsbD (plasmid) [Thiothrix fructosivorans]|uniref:Protein-disulfide reductase DsbD n=1 Tax=Thiothrix fructosivorans TaxID=111770 RepID=A0A8B0SVD1_9GAMM|nr:protein-disulfide reductase DsbD [Thiothrix fructosivorans]QTX12922.1 protein-disulfide reductase DsbD [Thiothrix fructosivorans]